MSKRNIKDYMALQNAWNMCVMRYLGTIDPEIRILVVDDFRDALIDIKPDGVKALRSTYEKWENDNWIPFCRKKLDSWIQNNGYEGKLEENCIREYENIKCDYNHLRFRKIMQVIQDSGIGLGAGRERGHFELDGFKGDGNTTT